jgi:putative transposase
MDNVFLERLSRGVKHGDICLREYASLPALGVGLESWFERDSAWRTHEALGNRTPQGAHAAAETLEVSAEHDRKLQPNSPRHRLI